MKTLLLFLLIICSGLVLKAQDTLYQIKGKVIEEITKKPLRGVSIRLNQSLSGTNTDSTGNFTLNCKNKKAVIQLSRIGYKTKYVQVDAYNIITHTIEMSVDIQELTEVNINSKAIEHIIKKESQNVLDYVLENGKIILITYTNNLLKAKLILLSTSLDTLSKINVPEEAVALFTDCLGNNHLIGTKKTYQIYCDSTQLKLMPPVNLTTFEKLIYPCKTADGDNLYLGNKYGAEMLDIGFHPFLTVNYGVTYFTVNKKSKEQKFFAAIQDDEIAVKRKEEIYNEEIKARAEMYGHGSPELDRLFAETIEFKEIYAPIFNLKGQVYIFDHVNSILIKSFADSSGFEKIPISYHKEKNWKREILTDPVSGKAYSLYASKGISELREIDVQTGKTTKTYKIPFTFPKTIKVYNNQVYFIHKSDFYYPTWMLTRMILK
ncbi:MAG TPA: carboxypeptidase-like regulatory domain-containing protein [Bacteroidia bacterium]